MLATSLSPSEHALPHTGASQANHRFWQQCQDTHLARGDYYRRVQGLLPLLCELHLKPQDVALDVGCGDGEYTALIAEHCRHVLGFDLSQALVTQAQARGLPNASFELRDIASLEDKHALDFDAVFIMGVFTTLHGERLMQVVRALGRMLKPGGVMITRDSICSGPADLSRRVHGDYHAHYRTSDNFLKPFQAQELQLVRCVFIEKFTQTENYFFVFRKPG